MFSKPKHKSAPSAASAEDGKPDMRDMPPSIISGDLTITGDLVSEGEIQVDGKVEGDIRCKSLLVGVNGKVLGEVNADGVRIHGAITGQVHARSVFLASTARMTGDVTHESLAIEPGAFVEGHCRRMAERRAAEAKAEVKAEANGAEKAAVAQTGNGKTQGAPQIAPTTAAPATAAPTTAAQATGGQPVPQQKPAADPQQGRLLERAEAAAKRAENSEAAKTENATPQAATR